MSVKLESDTIGMLLTDVSRLLRGAFDRRINASGVELTPGEARTLIQVALAGGIKQADIAIKLGIEPMTLSTYLDRLEALELVQRVPDPGDRRAKNVVITDTADLALTAIRTEVRELMEQVTVGLEPAAREMLRSSLQMLRDNLQQIDRGTLDKNPAGKNPAP
ncbi:DNA-binding MarR family transcriptional regulator [Pararhizobium capsulatum DSM 1112]|uniref:DNA-binding MarR family transcriptional regulator n=1 Tax=Pararhizobium capsulatum DSM 1112 TaxID=1121113 RepID=A0ABU0BIG7_9HYPH|nr:MarR family transcriptional regulator [Pararhizobium capsulatum]MDQ0318045.1 DNA-binding MarR family transcriptional regulator [Pararhizobium capsulatum DSM 1112]